MAKYRIKETYKVTRWSYLEADSPEEALRKFDNGEGDHNRGDRPDTSFHDWKPETLQVEKDGEWARVSKNAVPAVEQPNVRDSAELAGGSGE